MNERGQVIDCTRLDRMLAFDEEGGALTAEGGVTLKRIVEAFLPRGWFLPVTPGTRYVTLGGAIAADVHGKNHHGEGSIARYVDAFELVLPSGEAVVCSRDENAELFFGTLGGMGLTGVIRWATLRLRRVETNSMTVTYTRARDLRECFEAFGDDAAGANAQPYAVAWIDCLAGGAKLGRSVIMAGRHTRLDELAAEERRSALRPAPERCRNVPIDFPGAALNKWSVKAFNAAYFHKHDDGVKLEPLQSFFYPLDAVSNWNRIYGKRGFQQYQVVLPFDAAERGMRELLTRLSRSGRASFLAVLKTMGPESGGVMSFPMPGWTLALDLANAPGLNRLLRELDEVTLSFNGRRYLAKDASLDPSFVSRMYPRLEEFRALRDRIDPERRLSSSLSRRLGLDGPR